MPTDLEAVVINPPSAHKASVIWLHGLGADGHDFEPIVSELGLPEDHGIRFIFPHAPVRPVTINAGMAMRAWYDVKSQDLRRQEDAQAIEDSKEIINRFIAAEIQDGIASPRIVLAGFSQGGAIALHCGLRFHDRLGGLLALSCYLPLPGRLAAEKSPANLTVPILMLHGVFDPVIPISAGQQSCDLLKRSGYNIKWHTYPMQHSVCLEEVEEISRWLQSILAQP
ncbi:MAG: alpha/beta hydrolase [Gammaproteobacteria bacterium]